MIIPEACLRAVLGAGIGPFWWRGEWLTRDGADIKRCGNWLAAKDEALRLNATEAARRVILALASDLPESAIEDGAMQDEGARPVNISAEACAVACMLVSNPLGEVRGVGWQRRVNDLIRAQSAELTRLRERNAELEKALKPFGGLRVGRFMTDGLKYDFRLDVAWIREANAALASSESVVKSEGDDNE